jgi:hypothetical protein
MLELDSVYKVSGWNEKLGNYRKVLLSQKDEFKPILLVQLFDCPETILVDKGIPANNLRQNEKRYP